MKKMNAPLDRGQLAQLACLLEVTARKPGNVHRFRDFDDAHYLDFLLSASVLGRVLRPDRIRSLGIGTVILQAVEETKGVVGHNTNLGMILLLTPMAGVESGMDLRAGIARILDRLTVDDARAVYQAVRLARPGGLRTAPEQDVGAEPTVTLREAMRLAADRDAIARQYVTDYADVFECSMPALRDALQSGRPLETATVLTHLTLMIRCPDSLIARKCGRAIAEESARRAAEVLDAGWPDTARAVDLIRELDAWLRLDGHARNPGSTADLIAATLFAALWDGTIERPRHLSRSGWDGGDIF